MRLKTLQSTRQALLRRLYTSDSSPSIWLSPMFVQNICKSRLNNRSSRHSKFPVGYRWIKRKLIAMGSYRLVLRNFQLIFRDRRQKDSDPPVAWCHNNNNHIWVDFYDLSKITFICMDWCGGGCDGDGVGLGGGKLIRPQRPPSCTIPIEIGGFIVWCIVGSNKPRRTRRRREFELNVDKDIETELECMQISWSWGAINFELASLDEIEIWLSLMGLVFKIIKTLFFFNYFYFLFDAYRES